MERIYDSIIDGKTIDIVLLHELGFSDIEIKSLEEKNILTKDNSVYHLVSVNGMIEYAKKLIRNGDYEKSNLYFEKCHELEPDNIIAWHELFLKKIRSLEFEKAFELCKELEPKYNSLANYYIFLLSNITELPDKYNEFLKQMDMNKIKTQDTNLFYDLETQNKIRRHSLYRNFTYALKLSNDYNAKKEKLSIYDIVLKTLLQFTLKSDKKTMGKLIFLANEKEYEKIIEIINSINRRTNLKRVEEYALKLCNMITGVKLTKIIPFVTINEPNDIFEAIDGNNIDKMIKFLEQNDGNELLSILIKDLNNEINKIKSKNIGFDDSLIYDTIKYYLLQNDIRSAFRIIDEYLKNNNKSEYEFLVFDLIKISTLKNNVETLNIKDLLNNLNLDISFYIDCYYEALKKDINIAKVYLDIIDNISKINNIEVDMKKLCMAMYPDDYDDLKYMELIDKINKILNKEKGIVLLDEESKETTKKIIKFLKLYPNIEFYIINGDGSDKIVLKYRPIQKRFINIDELLSKRKEMSQKGEYKKCLGIELEILANSVRSDSRNYSRIGYTYLKMNESVKALDYFIVANYFAKREKNGVNYNDIISKLKNNEEFNAEKNDINASRYYDLADEMKIFNDNCKRLSKEKGVILLEPMSDEQIDRILKNSKSYFNIKCYVIENDNEKRIVLEYKNSPSESIDVQELLNLSKYYYENKEYLAAIDLNLKIISNVSYPGSLVYFNIAISYIKLGDKAKALDYLIIANYYAKKDNKDITYDELIERIKNELANTSDKQYIINLKIN